MKRRTILTSVLFVFSALIFHSCTDDIFCEDGEGPIVEKEVPVEMFNGIDLASSFDAKIIQGDEQRVIAIGNENIIYDLNLDVREGVWQADLEGGCHTNFSLRLEITLPSIQKIKTSGSGDVTIAGFDNLQNLRVVSDGSGDIQSTGTIEVNNLTRIKSDGSGDIELEIITKDLDLEMDGSGDVWLAGQADDAFIELDGSGDLHAFSMMLFTCEIISDGSGSAGVYVDDFLEVFIGGSGNVYYRGDPEINSRIDGLGNLINDN